MKFAVQYLSFFVIQNEGSDPDGPKKYKHYQTLTHEEYQDSELKVFLDGEFKRIAKRKAEINAVSEQVPTKIGRFIVEPGHDLTSNPNYNLFQRLRTAADKAEFHNCGDDLLRIYMDTNSVRGGAFVLATAKLNELYDDPFLFLFKCDFETKIARVSDEKSLISQVEMAINAKNIKSIQYPHMPEEGMLEEWELKIHQASHARYFEDFLKYVSYEKSKPEIVADQVMEMVNQYMETKWQGADIPYYHTEDAEEVAETEEVVAMRQEKQQFDVWAAGEKRELQEKWTHEHVVEATKQIVELQPDLELKFKLDDVLIKGHMDDYGNNIHIARMNGRYIVLIEGDNFQFDKGVSPIELLHPEEMQEVMRRLGNGVRRRASGEAPALD
ncbi:DUF3900 domain-containing protein [Cohnella cholangitidis]|uniref:DUF3900 domain-containing protein n=1 Tax=Cohnella cholangitidis TaxID=2598458 RepID=A0A7G5BXY7_9BACL|nr:DUF3900 domain-containing protein [Cohnella cholangitidis]QMV41821.1 DUF3900 domain-containing protein [Cohnella cholangitidis]